MQYFKGIVFSSLVLGLLCFQNCKSDDGPQNRPPEVEDQAFNLVENAENGLVIGQIIATDPDRNQKLSFEIISGNENGAFGIIGESGTLVVANSNLIDYETENTAILEIEVKDNFSSPGVANALVTISILNIQEISLGSLEFDINENSENGFIVGTVTGNSNNGPVELTIVSGNELGVFDLNGSSGELSVANSIPLNYEENPSFNLVINASDGADMLTENLEINVIDVDELYFENQTFSIDENPDASSLVGDIIVDDPEGDNYVVTLNDAQPYNPFSISSDGRIQVEIPCWINFERTNEFLINASVISNGLSGSAVVTVTINDVDETASELENGLVTYYDLDGNASDGGLCGIDGTIVGPIATMDRKGNPTGALMFDGVNDYIDLGLSSVLSLGEYDEFTISVWVKSDLETIAESGTIFSKYISASNNRFFNLYMIPEHNVQFAAWKDGATSENNAFNSTISNEWTHIVVTKTSTNWSMFINGNIEVSLTPTFTIETRSTSAKAVLGATHSTGNGALFDRNFNGTIDDFRLYDRALTSSEIESLYLEVE